jgi:hypothetical protein
MITCRAPALRCGTIPNVPLIPSLFKSSYLKS